MASIELGMDPRGPRVRPGMAETGGTAEKVAVRATVTLTEAAVIRSGLQRKERSMPAYGLWTLVVLNSVIFILFAFSFFKPTTRRDWRSFGAFGAFLVALFNEMYRRLSILEEREALETFGATYRAYAARVPRFIPRPRKRTGNADEPTGPATTPSSPGRHIHSTILGGAVGSAPGDALGDLARRGPPL